MASIAPRQPTEPETAPNTGNCRFQAGGLGGIFDGDFHVIPSNGASEDACFTLIKQLTICGQDVRAPFLCIL
jgi:hypothetical protein